MLRLTGKCLGVTTETVNGPSGAFQSTKVHVLDGLRTVEVRVAREFPPGDLPREGEDLDLEVVVSAFSRRAGGAGVQVTAVRKIEKTGARVAAAS